MYENNMMCKPQWTPVTFDMNDTEHVTKIKFIIARMLQFEPDQRMLMEDVEKEIKAIRGSIFISV